MDEVLARFWRKIWPGPGECWLWMAARDPNGYARFGIRVDGKSKIALAHRWIYQRLVGPIPEGLDLDHLCRVRHCVNPAHLEPVTRSENLRRSPLMGRAQLAKTHCPQGHPYEGENLLINAQGRRVCRACNREKMRQARKQRTPEQQALYRERDASAARRARERKAGRPLQTPNAAKTRCAHGHEYSEENTYRDPTGARHCRACIADRKARRS